MSIPVLSSAVKPEKKRVRLAIGVMSSMINARYRDQLKGCMDTWGSNANLGLHKAKDVPSLSSVVREVETKRENNTTVIHYYCGEFGDSTSPEIIHLPGVKDDYASATYKQWLGYKHLSDNYDADFYLMIGTDNYVCLDRLHELLDGYDSDQLLIISGFADDRGVRGKPCHFPYGGGGIIFTRESMKVIYPKIDYILEAWPIVSPELKDQCDVAVGYYADQWGIPVAVERHLYSMSWTCAFNGDDTFTVHGPMKFDKIVICHNMEYRDHVLYHKYRDRVVEYNDLLKEYRKIAAHDREVIEKAISGCTSAAITTKCPQNVIVVKNFIDSLGIHPIVSDDPEVITRCTQFRIPNEMKELPDLAICDVGAISVPNKVLIIYGSTTSTVPEGFTVSHILATSKLTILTRKS